MQRLWEPTHGPPCTDASPGRLLYRRARASNRRFAILIRRARGARCRLETASCTQEPSRCDERRECVSSVGLCECVHERRARTTRGRAHTMARIDCTHGSHGSRGARGLARGPPARPRLRRTEWILYLENFTLKSEACFCLVATHRHGHARAREQASVPAPCAVPVAGARRPRRACPRAIGLLSIVPYTVISNNNLSR